MAVSVREQIMAAILTRLESMAPGQVKRCEPVADRFPAVSIWDVDEDANQQHGVNVIQLPLAVEFVDTFDDDQQHHAQKGGAMLADLIKQLTGTDPTFGGLADGCQYTGAVTDYPDASESLVAIRAVFTVRYRTALGDPFTQV